MKNLGISLLLMALITASPLTMSRPEIMREGMSYYSDEYVEQDSVKDLVGEKNIEEVYQNYTYYEVIYDGSGRVKEFKEYKRGAVILHEKYSYSNESSSVPGTRTVLVPGKEPEISYPAKSN